ncbi:MAG: PIG-L family deacetylase [Clostridiales bacterium]|jgi:LmbE family N-acetylglucosaminyl deacetylase|nr:PIG-L family deacetylase [Clostridiales bacterium]
MINALLLHILSPRPKLTAFSRYVFIGPHPDDIEIGAGGAAAALCAMGKEVHFIIVTDGRGGGTDGIETPDRVAEIRRAESLAAAKILGARSVVFLDFFDGGDYSEYELTARLCAALGKLKPDMIFAPDPKIKNECHPDHIKCGNAAGAATLFAGLKGSMQAFGSEETADIKALGYYYTDKPNRFISVRKTFKKQIEAFAAHKSQALAGEKGRRPIDVLPLYFTFRGIKFGLRSLKLRAEGFRVVTPLEIHCCPESR